MQASASIPTAGDFVEWRTRRWLVESVSGGDALVRARLACIDDDAQGETLEVIWRDELDASVIGAVNASRWQGPVGFPGSSPSAIIHHVRALIWQCSCGGVRNEFGGHMTRNGWLAVSLFSLIGAVSASGKETLQKIGNWSGFILESPDVAQATPPKTFTFVRARWTQPTVFCTTPSARVSIWVGLDGGGTPTIEQTGTVAVCGTAAAPLYYKVFWEMFNGTDNMGDEPFTVAPGDIIEASVAYIDDSYLLEVKDVSSGLSSVTTHLCSTTVICKRGSAEWIVERPGGVTYPLADYGKVEFSKVEWIVEPSKIEAKGSDRALELIEAEMFNKDTSHTLSKCSGFWDREHREPDPIHFDCKWRAAE
jgi:hypothetical protein